MLHELVTVNNSPVKDFTIMDNHISPSWSNGGYIHYKESK